jgi:hypothetical protein
MFEGIEECLSLKDVTETCEVEVRMGIIAALYIRELSRWELSL